MIRPEGDVCWDPPGLHPDNLAVIRGAPSGGIGIDLIRGVVVDIVEVGAVGGYPEDIRPELGFFEEGSVAYITLELR